MNPTQPHTHTSHLLLHQLVDLRRRQGHHPAALIDTAHHHFEILHIVNGKMAPIVRYFSNLACALDTATELVHRRTEQLRAVDWGRQYDGAPVPETISETVYREIVVFDRDTRANYRYLNGEWKQIAIRPVEEK